MAYITGKNLTRRSDRTDLNLYSDFKFYSNVPTSLTLKEEGSYLSTAKFSKYYGWDIPDFHRKLKEKQLLPHTPWNRLEITGQSVGDRKMWFNSGGEVRHTVGNYTPFNDWYLTELQIHEAAPALDDKYVQQAASKIYSNSWDALTFVAELASIKGQFRGAIDRLLSLKRPKGWKALMYSKIQAGEWLSYRYGWRVLLYDIQDIFETIHDWNDKRKRYSERSGNRWTTSNTDVRTVTYSNRTLDVITETKTTNHLRGSVTADISLPKIMANPVATAWELIPFSFVIDWFISVGQAIEAASFDVLEQAYSASTSFLSEMDRTMYTEIVDFDTDVLSRLEQYQEGSCNSTYKVRKPCGVSVKPHFTLRIDNLKIADLLALVKQRFRR